ncbi:PAS domain-containing protein [Lysobacter sp. HA18]
MNSRDVMRVIECLPGNYALLRAVPGYPIAAVSRQLAGFATDANDVIGRPLFDVFPEAPEAPGSVARLAASFDNVITTRFAARHEQRFDVFNHEAGRFEERYWSAFNTPIFDDDGNVAYILHHSEDAATEARHGSTAILDAMTEGVFTLDRQWRFNYVNPEAYRILRHEPGSLRGKMIWEHFPGTEESAFGEHYRRTMEERRKSSFTAFYPGMDSWYEVTAYPAPEGISVYFRDVTTQVLAEQERERVAFDAERQARLYETALNNTPDFVYIFDTDHRALYANEALLKVWGVDDVRGKTWMELGYEQWHADMHDRELAQVIETKAPIRGEIPFTGTNGRRIYDYIFAPVLDPSGDVVAVAGTTRDVTERKAAEQIVRDHADRLSDADRAKDAFLATLSHELRNPLAPLRNGVEILRRMSDATGPQARVHSMMERQVNHLVRLVDDLMEVSRITRGNVPLHMETFTLESVIESAVEAARPVIDAGRHELSIELPNEPVWLQGDRVRIAQIVANLLNNAAKYSDPDGQIAVLASVAPGNVMVSIRDTGIGMELSEIPHLFEMFTRGDRVKATHQGGLGIGLALARRLATLHGGSLDAISDGPGTGSTFTLTLPCIQGADMTETATVEVSLPQLSLRVLVVDDNVDVGNSLAQTLGMAGAEVQVEDNGTSGVEAYDRFRPDVAIVDIGMPQVTGYDVAAMLRSKGATIPLVALTGWGQTTDRERALAAGFDHHLVKPVAIPLLIRLLKSMEDGVRASN